MIVSDESIKSQGIFREHLPAIFCPPPPPDTRSTPYVLRYYLVSKLASFFCTKILSEVPYFKPFFQKSNCYASNRVFSHFLDILQLKKGKQIQEKGKI